MAAPSGDTPVAPPADAETARTLRVGTTQSSGGFYPWANSMTYIGMALVYNTPYDRLTDGT